ncbi:DCC1-like thiol-disulfide oxidoreductase family protein [Brevundimonas fontaquae]|nr:DCC1-like thiol-disulfide oxidoreductase family protein [Brevundimonas fontaquae]
MRRLDRRGAIRFVDVSDGQASCPLDRETLLARFHATENGRLLSGAAAFAAMWRAIPLLRPLGLAARIPWVLAALERAYRVFLRLRPDFSLSLANGPGDGNNACPCLGWCWAISCRTTCRR